MMETYLFYSIITLFAMGCLALVLFAFFRLKSRAISNIPKDLSPSIFDKTFNVFNPYPEHRKIINSFLSMFPILIFLASFGSAFAVFIIFEYGLILSLLMLIICLNLMTVKVVPEVYQNTENLIKAVQRGTSLGVGDLEVLQFLRGTLPRLSNYYLGLSILFMGLALTLGYIWSSVLWIFTQYIALTIEVGAVAGLIGWMVSVFLFVLTVAFIQIFISKIRSELLGYLTKMPAVNMSMK